jgi:sugar phosphate isomerase/epimerase
MALHTWTLDTTPLAELLRIATDLGWDAVELRRLDWNRAADKGQPPESVTPLVERSGLPVACVGVEAGWMFADGDERRRLLTVFREQCRRAVSLGCLTLMSPADKGAGPRARAAASVREVGDMAAEHGLRLAVEFNSQAEQLNRLERVREILATAGHPSCGLLLDSYHLGRTEFDWRLLEDLSPDEIFHVQISDVPRAGLRAGMVLDRLPPGEGSVPFREFSRYLEAKHYEGYASYEAPNEAAWAQDARAVARAALAAMRLGLRA